MFTFPEDTANDNPRVVFLANPIYGTNWDSGIVYYISTFIGGSPIGIIILINKNDHKITWNTFRFNATAM